MTSYRTGLGILMLVGIVGSSAVVAGPLPLHEVTHEPATVLVARSVGPRLKYSVFVGGRRKKGA